MEEEEGMCHKAVCSRTRRVLFCSGIISLLRIGGHLEISSDKWPGGGRTKGAGGFWCTTGGMVRFG